MKLKSWTLLLPLVALTSISPIAQAAPQANTEMGKCSDWSARLRIIGRPPQSLYVTGKCTFPTDGYSVKLVPLKVQPKDLTLRLQRVVTPPSDSAAQVVSVERVSYIQPRSTGYRQVLILPDRTVIPVKPF